MDPAELQRTLDEVFDQAIVYHGFTDYMRDYEVVFHCTADPRTGAPPANVRFRFKHCVVAEVRTAVSAETWRRSLDDRLTSYETGVDLDGYVWGVKWQVNYPGPTIVADSPRAATWADDVGIPFHELRFETNGHNLSLVFHDLSVDEVESGYAPHVLGPGGPDHKIPFGAD